jgi:hypothetical protein
MTGVGNEAILQETTMTQYSMKKGMKTFGEPAVAAVIKELWQQHARAVMVPVTEASLSRKQKHDALQYLMFRKQKRCRKIKEEGVLMVRSSI